ncbi:hypothetical protein N7532_011990 [Penicillium argentinense]|uniref:DNA 3'-5' helicase n=1 Tax=Penicillium argentinense TaxID=1131581 RepID=A0A9W9EJH2_9EURO|nr:uncharacterized protein N7532_011990 [Penicillium argentinense]KAJ5082947.1 hypothetical protein N7532_011990 [Penicillium argentinense]
MRRNQLSQSKLFQISPKRRQRTGSGPAGSSQSSRIGVIDQRLIEGSQQPRSQTRSSPVSTSAALFSDNDESELDAFDLELLASENSKAVDARATATTPSHAYGTANNGTQNALSQTSRFFTREYRMLDSWWYRLSIMADGNYTASSNIISLHEIASSQPEILRDPPSSPLALIHQRKEAFWTGRRSLESRHDGLRHDANQLPSQQTSSSRPNNEQDTSGNVGQGRSPFANIPLSVRGIVLVPVTELTEQHRSLFPFPMFNAIQSKCFDTVFKTNNNLVLSAPTGSGKTVVMELAICRLLNVLKDERFKVVYQAPTKSLCAERFRDWNSKFSALNLKCAELTGDTDQSQLRGVQNSQIIITTPEKWDSMTRKWKDHMRLMQLVKLFLIDEVHILKESRGATLEAVVSRMKNIGSNVRFIALSATVPNSEDIATWLGKDATTQYVPAHREHFGEDFRPVKLQKFVYGYHSNGNDFAFDKLCGGKLPGVIEAHSCQKPIMVFCCTRNSSVATAKELARLWTVTNPPARHWEGPTKHIVIHNEDLRGTVCAGVAFHHAGLSHADRHAVEKGFLDGHINVICCTSTLAVGVNLPCHLVVIKNTVSWQEGGCKEYSDLEMMQMLGRAGRPQFDNSATAIILTRKERVSHYEKLVSGSESLESCLHLNLIDHLNAEIGLGNVTDLESATRWLAGTFLFVRLRRNPTYYKLKEGASQEDEDKLLRQICERDISLLQECGLVERERLCSTQFGDAMARYYIRFETMRTLLSLESHATISQILDVIVQGEEFREIRLKAGEKSLYREINKDPGIRYPIKVDVALPSHKISLLLQAELGAIDFPNGDQFQKHKFSFQQDKSVVFSHVNRLIRCVIDCHIAREDAISVLNALELARSFGAKVWDHSPLQMKQIEQIGVVAVRKLAAAGIMNLEDLESTEPHKIEMALSKNPPFGTKLLARVREFPKLRVAVKMIGKETEAENVKVRFKLEVAFMNDKIPTYFQRRPIYVCCLSEASDGRLVDFRRVNASKLQEGLEASLVADLHDSGQSIVCHVMCDDIAGTARQARIKPDIPPHLFPLQQSTLSDTRGPRLQIVDKIDLSTERHVHQIPKSHHPKDTFDGDDLELDDFLVAGQALNKSAQKESSTIFPLDDLDWFSIDSTPSPPRYSADHSQSKNNEHTADTGHQDPDDNYVPIRLSNGNWACNHRCKDKKSCKHLCCRDGLEKPPKPSKCKTATNLKASGLSQLTLSASITKPKSSDENSKKKIPTRSKKAAKRKTSQRSDSSLSSAPQRKKRRSTQIQIGYKHSGKSAMSQTQEEKRKSLSRSLSRDYGDDDGFNDLPSPSALFDNAYSSFVRPPPPTAESELQKDDNSSYIDPSILSMDEDIILDQSKKTDAALQAESPTMVDSQQDSNCLETPARREIIVLSDSSVCGSAENIFSSTEKVKSTATTVLLATSPTNTARSPKGKERVPDLALVESNPSQLNQYPLMSTLHEILAVPSAPFLSMDQEDDAASDADDGAVGYEDIDRMLYEEYKDIINFH